MATLDHRINLIYGMIDPLTNELRYIGKTYLRPGLTVKESLNKRLLGHLKSRKITYHSRWVKGLLAVKEIPEIFLIEKVGVSWADAEKFWISYFKTIGSKLTNTTEGGEDFMTGKTHTE